MDDVVRKLLIEPQINIGDAVKVIDKGRFGIAMVVDKDNKLLGIVTDVDVRKALLKGISMDMRVERIMNTKPIVAPAHLSEEELKNYIIQVGHKAQVPIVDEMNRVVGIRTVFSLFKQEEISIPVVIMAGGSGSRLMPLTAGLPKPMLKIDDIPILEIMLLRLREAGFRNFYISLNYQAEVIERHFGNGEKWHISIKYLLENKKLGTVGALSLLDDIGTPFMVLNGDLLTSLNFRLLLQFHLRHRYIATIGIRRIDLELPYGVVDLNDGLVSGINEKPITSFNINAGIYIFNLEILKLIPRDTPLDMPELIVQLIKSGEKIGGFPIIEYWLDVGRMDDYKKAQKDYPIFFKDARNGTK